MHVCIVWYSLKHVWHTPHTPHTHTTHTPHTRHTHTTLTTHTPHTPHIPHTHTHNQVESKDAEETLKSKLTDHLEKIESLTQVMICTCSYTSLIPRSCTFITCSMEFCVNFVLQATNTQCLGTWLLIHSMVARRDATIYIVPSVWIVLQLHTVPFFD